MKFIQRAILDTEPSLRGTQFTIETNQHFTINGVRHEVDVLVKTLPASPYESVWIFECKNWKRTVGKNEPIVLAEKVKALRANRGFFVARRISKHAKAQLDQDKRLGFIPCTDDFLSPLNRLELVHTVREPQTIEVRLKERGLPVAEQPAALYWKGEPCLLNNAAVNFTAFLRQQADEVLLRSKWVEAEQQPHEGEMPGERSVLLKFEEGELKLGCIDVEWIALLVRFTTRVRIQRLLSSFELQGQGRVFSFEPIDNLIPGKLLEVDVVQRI